MNERLPVIFDTDIGSDIDDALALAYLLRQPRCELLGITTVTGDVAKRAALAESLCRAAGREDVPVHLGASSPLSGPGQPDVPQYAAVAGLPHRLDRPADTAVAFIRDAVRARPGEVTLVSVGPFTSLALLAGRYPGALRLLKGWVSMAGLFFPERGEKGRRGEWNSVCDPLAAALALRRGPPHVHVGLDVTLRCRLSADEARRRFQGPLLELVLRLAASWFERHDTIVFHDPLAAAVAFRPGLCRYEAGRVSAAPDGSTSFAASEGGPDRVASEVDVEAFFDEFFAVAV